MVKMKLDTREFDSTLKKYIKANGRDMGMLVEKAGRKLAMGQASKQAPVKGVMQLFKAHNTTKGEIRKDTEGKRVIVVHKGKMIHLETRRKKRGKGWVLTDKGKRQLAAIRNKRSKSIGYLTANYIFPGWRVGRKGSTRSFPSKVGKQTRAIIKTERANPYVELRSDTEGVVKMGNRWGVFQKALNNVNKDMMLYVSNKLSETGKKHFGRN